MHSYSLYDVEKFPESPAFQTNPQLEQIHTPQTTTCRQVGHLNIGFIEYDVQHFTRIRFRGIPYYHNEPIDEVVEKHTFPAFLHERRSFLLMRYGKGVCDEAAKRLNKLEAGTKVYRPELDLKELVKEVHGLWGTYFRDLEVPHLRSAALFGPNVDEGEFWDTFSKLGKVTAILTQIIHDGEPHKLMITHEYGVIFYRELTDAAELSVLLELKPILDRVRMQPQEEPEGEVEKTVESEIQRSFLEE